MDVLRVSLRKSISWKHIACQYRDYIHGFVSIENSQLLQERPQALRIVFIKANHKSNECRSVIILSTTPLLWNLTGKRGPRPHLPRTIAVSHRAFGQHGGEVCVRRLTYVNTYCTQTQAVQVGYTHFLRYGNLWQAISITSGPRNNRIQTID